jgi:hypothetical protein
VRGESNTKKGEKMNKENKGRKYGWGIEGLLRLLMLEQYITNGWYRH